MASDRFQIHSYFRFMLVLRAFGPVVLIGIMVWALSSPYLRLTDQGPFIILALVGWAIWEFVTLFRWFNFSVELSDEGINISGTPLKWADLASGRTKTAFQFSTFIELKSKDGRTFKIPACIQQNSFVLAKIEKHFPDINKES